ncbi:MAG: phosphoribosylaminoimidazolesuccinocarboxamide synthase, partial [Methanosarcina sp.]
MKREQLYSGKAKTIYRTDDPDTLIAEFRNSLTAFNGEKKGEMELKGYYNAQISKKIFEMLEASGVKTHFVSMLTDIDMLVREVEIIKIEVIVRNIAAGSITRKYPIKEGTILKPPVLVFDFKSDEYGDPMLNDDIALALGIATREELAELRK